MKFDRLKILMMNETFVKSYKTRDGKVFEIDKNGDLSNMEENVRGLVLPNGDFYTGKSVETNVDNGIFKTPLIHADLMNAILGISSGDAGTYSTYSNFKKMLNVQRVGKTDVFKLGESYEDAEIKKIKHSPDVHKMILNFRKKNPKIYINLVPYYK